MGLFNRDNKIVIRYMGGLGNQMFQYAFRCNFEKKNKSVKDDIFFYKNNPNAMPFELKNSFPKILLEEAQEKDIDNFYIQKKNRSYIQKIKNKLFPYTRIFQNEKKELFYDPKILKVQSAYITGYWQNYRYVQNVKEILYERFEFPRIENEKIVRLIECISNENSVSLHIRAGDYLLPENVEIFGNICTLQYYKDAIQKITEKIKTPMFFVFSNDINWCKQNIPLENVIWMDEISLPEHEDWVEMYLMSCCKHNIIANSSFSWWAAWLNKNPKKIVVAPKQWLKNVEKEEMCPKEWIRI